MALMAHPAHRIPQAGIHSHRDYIIGMESLGVYVCTVVRFHMQLTVIGFGSDDMDRLLKQEITSKRGCQIKRRCGRCIPPFWGSFAYHTPRYGFCRLTPCKIIILGQKIITQ